MCRRYLSTTFIMCGNHALDLKKSQSNPSWLKKNLNPTQQNFTNKLNQNIIHTKQINKIKPPLQQNAASQRFNANSHKKKSYPLFAHVTKPRKVSLLKKKDHKAGNVDNTLMEQFFILLFAFPRTFPRAEAAFSHLGPT